MMLMMMMMMMRMRVIMLILKNRLMSLDPVFSLLLRQEDDDFNDITEDELDLGQAFDSGEDFVLH